MSPTGRGHKQESYLVRCLEGDEMRIDYLSVSSSRLSRISNSEGCFCFFLPLEALKKGQNKKKATNSFDIFARYTYLQACKVLLVLFHEIILLFLPKRMKVFRKFIAGARVHSLIHFSPMDSFAQSGQNNREMGV